MQERRRRTTAIGAIAVIGALIMAGCSGDSDDDTSSDDTGSGQVATQGLEPENLVEDGSDVRLEPAAHGRRWVRHGHRAPPHRGRRAHGSHRRRWCLWLGCRERPVAPAPHRRRRARCRRASWRLPGREHGGQPLRSVGDVRRRRRRLQSGRGRDADRDRPGAAQRGRWRHVDGRCTALLRRRQPGVPPARRTARRRP